MVSAHGFFPFSLCFVIFAHDSPAYSGFLWFSSYLSLTVENRPCVVLFVSIKTKTKAAKIALSNTKILHLHRAFQSASSVTFSFCSCHLHRSNTLLLFVHGTVQLPSDNEYFISHFISHCKSPLLFHSINSFSNFDLILIWLYYFAISLFICIVLCCVCGCKHQDKSLCTWVCK